MKKVGLFFLGMALFCVGFSNGMSRDEDSITKINHHASRYIFAPSAIPVNKGSFYYQNYNILLNDIQVGVTDNFGVGLGYSFPAFVYLTPKYSMPIKKNHTLAVGDIAVVSVFSSQENSLRFNIFYGMYTIGNSKNNVSFGLGLLQGNKFNGSQPITNLSGMYSISPNFYLVGEVWLNNRIQPFLGSFSNYKVDPVTLNYIYEDKHIKANLNRKTLFTSVQFKILGNKLQTTAWSFGISSLWESGDRLRYSAILPVYDQTTSSVVYQKQESVMGPKNFFFFIPSFTYMKKIAGVKDVSR